MYSEQAAVVTVNPAGTVGRVPSGFGTVRLTFGDPVPGTSFIDCLSRFEGARERLARLDDFGGDTQAEGLGGVDPAGRQGGGEAPGDDRRAAYLQPLPG
jgi:hypothetical protein